MWLSKEVKSKVLDYPPPPQSLAQALQRSFRPLKYLTVHIYNLPKNICNLNDEMMGALVSKEFSGVSVFVRREQLAPKLSVHSSRRGQVHRKTWRMTEALKCTVNAIINCIGTNSGNVQITEFFSHKHMLSNTLWGTVNIMATWLRQNVVYIKQTLHKQIWCVEKKFPRKKSLP